VDVRQAVVDLKDGEGRVEGEERSGSEDWRSGKRGVELAATRAEIGGAASSSWLRGRWTAAATRAGRATSGSHIFTGQE
jgi:hypothetical protein